MCGICGYLSFNHANYSSQEQLIEMSDTLIHRGPDGFGYHQDRGLGLGSRRLKIIDAVSGHQPMANEDGSIVVVFNGEIYNFKEIRETLKNKYTFKTQSDTEILIHLYQEKKQGMLKELNGMFSFALWDKKNELLFCARDRAGQKPFFYTFHNNYFVFASELKAILKFAPDLKTLNPASISKYLVYEYVPSPHTIFDKIKKLPAGHFLTVKSSGESKITQYWHLPLNGKTNGPAPRIISANNDQETQERLLYLFKQAIQRQLVSDVPLGAFLSGGVDSSSIVATMRHLLPGRPILTFSAGFSEKTFDESSYAQRVAHDFDTTHSCHKISSFEAAEAIPGIIEILDEPFSDSSIIPTYLLCKSARQRVKVALGGDGGDELFAGYPAFLGHPWLSQLNRPSLSWLKNFLAMTASRLPASYSNYGPDFLLKQFVQGFGQDVEIANQIWIGPFPPVQQQLLFSDPQNHLLDTENIFEDLLDFVNNGAGQTDWVNRLLRYYFHFYFAEDILTKVDRASMANSLEVRSPFLDTDFMEYAASLDPRLKLNGFRTKFIFKKAMKATLPEAIIRRRKQGFCMPIGDWFRHELKNQLTDVLSAGHIKSTGLFNAVFIQRLIEEHLSGKKNNWKQLWSLFIFQSWYDQHMSN